MNLASRIRKLEQSRVVVSIGDRLRRAQDAADRMSTGGRSAADAAHQADCVAALAESDAGQGIAARLQRARRRLGRAVLQEQAR
jgi:hypothetical protein